MSDETTSHRRTVSQSMVFNNNRYFTILTLFHNTSFKAGSDQNSPPKTPARQLVSVDLTFNTEYV
jgi:hypothetical protein